MNERSKEYMDYMQSETWKQKRSERLKIDEYRCVGCGTYGSQLNKIEVHHMGYKLPFGEEDPYRHLVSLCTVCHMHIHRIMKRPTDPSGVSWWNENTPQIHEYDFNRDALRETITQLGG